MPEVPQLSTISPRHLRARPRWAGWAGRSWAHVALSAALVATMVPRLAQAQLEQKELEGIGGAFEIKLGPYLPALGDEGGSPAFLELYGEGRTRVLVNFGVDLQVYRSHWVTVSLGGTVGYIAWDGNIPVPPDGQLAVGEAGSSTFTVVPMTFTVGARLDYFMQKTNLPLAPYVRAGLAYHLWWNSADLEGDDSGGRPGFVGTAGVAFPLNVIDPGSAARFYQGVGVRTTYLFFEGQWSVVDGFGDGDLDLSDTTWFAGLMVEF